MNDNKAEGNDDKTAQNLNSPATPTTVDTPNKGKTEGEKAHLDENPRASDPDERNCTQSMMSSESSDRQTQPKLLCSVVDPSLWSVEDVIREIVKIDKTMDIHANCFRFHEIDGKAMILLDSDVMIRFMGLDEETSVKIIDIINTIKGKNVKH